MHSERLGPIFADVTQSKGKANLAGRDEERKSLGITLGAVSAEAAKLKPFTRPAISHVSNVFAGRRSSRRVVTAYTRLAARRMRRLAEAS